VAFLLVNTAIIVALWESSRGLAALDIPWVPFRPHQLGALAVALLAPPVASVGILAILGFIGAAVMQFTLFDPAIREQLPYGDPFASLAYGGFALALYVHRLRATQTERDVARVQAEAEGFERLARAMCAFRDLSNTPLQTLVNSVELLRQRGVHDVADRIERAVLRLRQLEEHTRPYETQLHWQNGDEAWDPWAILRPSY
jgi:hypothetical protein